MLSVRDDACSSLSDGERGHDPMPQGSATVGSQRHRVCHPGSFW